MQELEFFLMRDSKPVWKERKKASECSAEEIDEANLRTIRPDEIVLDYESEEESDAGTARLKKEAYHFFVAKSPRGSHIHLLFSELLAFGKSERNKLRKRFIEMFNADISKASEDTLISIPNRPHFKNGMMVTVIDHDSNKDNSLPYQTLHLLKAEPPIDINAILKGVGKGKRDESAIRLATWFRITGNTEDKALDLMRSWNEKNDPPLSDREVETKVRSAYKPIQPYSFNLPPIKIQQAFEVKNATDFCTQYKDMKIHWLIDKMIPEGVIIMFAGKRASFKSWLAEHMAICLSKGESYLGFITNSQHKSLIIDAENNPILLSQRLAQLGGTPDTLILKDEGFRWEKHSDWLLDYCEQNGIKLVINDTFRRSHDADENDAGEISSLFQTHLRKFKDAGITLLLLYHLRKGMSGIRPAEQDLMDELRGSTELVNLPDVIYVIDRKRGTNMAIIHQVKNRCAQELEPMAVEVNIHETVTFATSLATEESLASVCAKALLKFMRLTERTTYKSSELREWSLKQGFGKKGIFEALHLLCQLQLLEKPQRGFYKLIKDQQQIQQFIDE